MAIPTRVTAASTDSNTVFVGGHAETINVFGYLGGVLGSIANPNTDAGAFTSTYLFVGTTDILDSAFSSVYLSGECTNIVNFGEISSTNLSGVFLNNATSQNTGTITNYGSISGNVAAIDLSEGGAL